MRQHGVNQFDKGLNLDINPIAMDNHQLTGALNATMITMNGNELVLQNDMGNGKVDQAQLPEGYVPVGMQEYGGIVYVASYNPKDDKSQIGCFPSPQRNFPSEDIGAGNISLPELQGFITEISNNVGIIKKLSEKKLLIGNKDIVRTGDKFVITASASDIAYYENKKDYIKLRVLVVNEEDGSSIDITDDLTECTTSVTVTNNNQSQNIPINNVRFLKDKDSTLNDSDYSIYGSRISGKIYIESKLIVPSYINTQILANKSGNEVTITIKPTAYDLPDENGNEISWTTVNSNNQEVSINNLSYVLSYSGTHYDENGNPHQFSGNASYINNQFTISQITYNGSTHHLGENDVLTYTLYPTYTYNGITGKVESLKRENTIDIGSIGTGDVDFSTFRYYNDMATETFVFDYGLNAYVEGFDGNNITINNIELEIIDVDDLLTNAGTSANSYDSVIKKTINLGITNYFGVYTRMIPYSDVDINFGKHYIGRIRVQVAGRQLQCSNWYSIITSTLTNKLYLNSSENMIKIQTNESDFSQHIFQFNWESEINRELVSEASLEQVDSESSVNGVLLDPPANINQRIKYETVKMGHAKYNHTGSIKIPQSRDINDAAGGKIKFPYSLSKTINLEYSDFDANANIDHVGGLGDAVTTLNNIISSNNELEWDGHNSQIWYKQSGDNITFNYRLWSQFLEKLLKNTNNSDNTVEGYKFTVENTMPVFLPYTPVWETPRATDQLETILGSTFSIEYTNNKLHSITAYHLTYGLDTLSWGDSGHDLDVAKSNSHKYVGISSKGYAQIGNPPDDDPDWHEVFKERKTSKSGILAWPDLSPRIATKIKELCSEQPPILMWSNLGASISWLYPAEWYHEDDKVVYYAIPLIQDQLGNYYAINQFTKGYCEFLLLIAECFNEIYVCQPDQQVEFNYWQGDTSSDGYVYTTNYQLTTTYKTSISIEDNTKPTITNNTKYQNYNQSGDGLSFTNNGLPSGQQSVTLKLPKIELVSGIKEQQYTDVVNAPDQSVKVAQLLTASTAPTFDTCAIVIDSAGETIIQKAYKSNGSITTFNPNHAYIRKEGTGSNTKLIDIEAPSTDLSTMSNSYGYYIAQAIRDKKLKLANSESGYKIIVVNPGKCARVSESSCPWWLGDCFDPDGSNNDRTARRRLVGTSGIVGNNMLDIQLFKNDWYIIKKLTDSWNS